MKVREILAVKGEHVHTIEPERTILDAVVLLVEHGIGALLVRDAGGAVAGILSERDVLRVCRDRSGALGTITRSVAHQPVMAIDTSPALTPRRIETDRLQAA